MKLVIGIVGSDDASAVLDALNKAHFITTRLSTTGGFLRAGNVTLLVGVEDSDVPAVLEIFKDYSSKRTQYTAAAAPFTGDGFLAATPVPVTVGGATVFVLDVAEFQKF